MAFSYCTSQCYLQNGILGNASWLVKLWMLLHLVKSLISKTDKIGLQLKLFSFFFFFLTNILITNKCYLQFSHTEILTCTFTKALYYITVLYFIFAAIKVYGYSPQNQSYYTTENCTQKCYHMSTINMTLLLPLYQN